MGGNNIPQTSHSEPVVLPRPLLTLNVLPLVPQVLIFSQMTSILDLLMDYCYLRGFQYSRLDGSMAYADREENVSVVAAGCPDMTSLTSRVEPEPDSALLPP